jgi:hypothetical protein
MQTIPARRCTRPPWVRLLCCARAPQPQRLTGAQCFHGFAACAAGGTGNEPAGNVAAHLIFLLCLFLFNSSERPRLKPSRGSCPFEPPLVNFDALQLSSAPNYGRVRRRFHRCRGAREADPRRCNTQAEPLPEKGQERRAACLRSGPEREKAFIDSGAHRTDAVLEISSGGGKEGHEA